MPELQLKQLRYEVDTRKRLLSFMMDEIVNLKKRLAQVLKDKFDETLLEEVESFQDRFLKEDALISLLRHDAAELDKLLLREIFENGQVKPEIKKKIKKLKSNIKNAEKQFAELKSSFNNYLIENIGS